MFVRRFAASAPGCLIGIRLAYLLGTAYTLLWAPAPALVRHAGTPYGTYGQLLFRTFDRWDSRWFVRIAEHGYATKQSAAFLPVYPMLVRGLGWVVRSEVVAGILIALAAAAACAWLLERIARRHLDGAAARTTVILFALYPLAFVFTAAYSDSLFLLFVLAAIDAAERSAPVTAGVAAAFAVDTRLLGLALVPALGVLLWPRRLGVLALLFIPAALTLWLLYCHVHFGDALATSHAEHRYWARQSPSPSAWWHELRELEMNVSNLLFHVPALSPGERYPGYVVVAAKSTVDLFALVAAAVLSWAAWRRLGPAYGLYSWTTLAIVVAAPARVEPLVSVTRFLLADFPLFLVLAALLEPRPRARTAVLVSFGAIGAVAAVGFAHGAGVA